MNTIAKGVVPRHFFFLGAFLAAAGLALLLRPPTLLAQVPAQPDETVCYAVANVPRDWFYVINPQTGIPAVVNSIEVSTGATLLEDPTDPQGLRYETAPTDVEALAFAPSRDPDDNERNVELFASSQRNFGVIDLSTAAFTPIGSIPTGFGVANGIALNNVDGLAYDDSNGGQMYAVQRRRSLGDPDLFFQVNMTTGEFVPDAFGPGKHYVEMSINGLSDLDDIAIDPTAATVRGMPRLYGTMNERGDGDPDGKANKAVILVTIEPETGAITKVGDIVTGAGSPVFDVEGLTFDAEGQLYGTSGANYSQDLNRFYKIDKTNGKATEINNLTQYPLYDSEAIACPPRSEPPPPRIMIKKYTNGEDADDPNGADVPLIAPGDPVTWTYEVTNIGPVDIPAEDITVTDNIPGVGPPERILPLPANDSVLSPGEIWLYQATGTAVNLVDPPPLSGLQLADNVCSQGGALTTRATAYTNIGRVVIPEDEDDDPSSYCPTPAITIEKSCNGFDADLPNQAGPPVLIGEELRWDYVITNTGGLNLVDIVLTDDPSGTITCPDTTLPVGESMTCTLTSTAVITGIIANLGTVVAYGEGYDTIFDRDDMRVEASDPSHCSVFGDRTIEGAIDLDSSMEFRWNYRVRNPDPATPDEAVPLRDVALDAGPGIATALVNDGASADGILNVGEIWTYSVAVPAQPVPSYPLLYTNLVTATAVTSATVSLPVSDTCQTQPYVLPPTLEVVANLNGNSTSLLDPLKVDGGDPLQWTYQVKNISTSPVSDVAVQQIRIDTSSGFVPATCVDTTLLPNQSTTCTTPSEPAEPRQVTTVATVAGRVATPTTCELPERNSVPVVENVLTYYDGLPASTLPASTAQVLSRVFGDYFTETTPANGLQDPDEVGIAGVKVTLVNAMDERDQVTASDNVEETHKLIVPAGVYAFTVPAGTYYVQFEVPADHALSGAQFTTPNQSANDHLDSDVEWANTLGGRKIGRTAPFDVHGGEAISGYDAGLAVPYVKPGTLYLPIIGH